MTKPMRWGILGASNFALRTMGPAIHAASGAQIVAVASRDTGKVAPFAEMAPGLRATDYDEMIEAEDIDAVYVPLPNHLHVPWGIAALEAGKHVLIEKPVGMDVGEVDRLIAARDAGGKHAAEAYMIAHHPQWTRAAALLAEGAIGEVVHVTSHFTYNNAADPGNVRNLQGMGGGALRDIGVYAFGSVQMTMGTPLTDVSAQWAREGDVDLRTVVQGRLGRATYAGYVSMRMAPSQGVTFHGTDGFMHLPSPFTPPAMADCRIELHRGADIAIERFSMARQYVNQVEAFGATARTGAPYVWTLEMARGTQEVLDNVMRVAEDIDP
ncbi:MAG: Gfo/Idh/MocA family oxidoreductase [Pseudomonadota bacterium]